MEDRISTAKIQKIQDSFRRQGLMAHIGAVLKEVREGYCEIHIAFSETLSQQHGFFHAGIVSTIIDNAAGYAAFSQMAETSNILTVEFKVNFTAPADGELLIGKARVIKHGKTLTICRAEAFVKKEGEEKLCAIGQCTLMEIKTRDT